jgi:hypothetical protein
LTGKVSFLYSYKKEIYCESCQMIIITCRKCGRKIFKYNKIGKGRILRCYKDRIVKTYSIKKQENVYCLCGQLIGIDEGKWIKMKQGSFDYSGSVTRK